MSVLLIICFESGTVFCVMDTFSERLGGVGCDEQVVLRLRSGADVVIARSPTTWQSVGQGDNLRLSVRVTALSGCPAMIPDSFEQLISSERSLPRRRTSRNDRREKPRSVLPTSYSSFKNQR